MQDAEVVLSMLGQKSIHNSEFVFDRLYRNLFNPDFYLLAYSTISAKEGKMTEGVDRSTPAGFNAQIVGEIIAALKTETYYPQLVRRTDIPAKNGSLRSLAISSFQDKLVQEVLRLLLQAIYEPLFKDTSHGFRPGRSCHTALVQLKTGSKGTNWVIEGDIQGGLASISHARLLEILSRKISDGRFLHLIERFLNAGYMEFWHVHNSLTGTPQGGIVGPILANIYLHELDVFMENTCNRLSTAHGPTRKGKRPDQALSLEQLSARKAEKYAWASEHLSKISVMPRQASLDPEYGEVKYIRYADDFLVMLIGRQDLAIHIREEIKDFLQRELQLELHMEKTVITHLKDRPVRFLGYDIARARETSLGVKMPATDATIQLLVPGDIIHERLKPFVSHGKAVHHNARVNLPLLDLLMQYNAEIQGLYSYYSLATDVSTRIGKYKYYHYYSLLKTVARKEKCSIAQVLSKYGVDVKLKQKTGTKRVFGISYQTEAGPKTLIYFNDSIKRMDLSQDMLDAGIPGREQLIDRSTIQADLLCNHQSDTVVHHSESSSIAVGNTPDRATIAQTGYWPRAL